VKGVALALLLFCALAPAASAQNADVQVNLNGEPLQLVSAEAINLKRDVAGNDANMEAVRSGVSQGYEDYPGTKIRTILELAGLSVDNVHQVSLPFIGRVHDPVVLDGNEIGMGIEHATRSGGTGWPNINTNYGSGFALFFRPTRGPGDSNGDDLFSSDQTHTITINVSTVNPTVRHVQIGMLPEHPKPGENVTFTASVTNPDSADFDYSWDFNDGGDREVTSEPTHSFGTGSWTVTVTANDQSGGSKSISFDVPPASQPTPTATASATPTGTPSGGEGPGGSGTGGPAPTGGGVGNEQDRTSGPRKSRGTTEKRRPGPKSTATPTPAAAATATATASATAKAAEGAGGTGGSGAAPAVAPRAESTATPTGSLDAPDPQATPEAATPPARVPNGVPVEGILLAGSGSVADIIAAARSAEATEQERSQARAGGGGSRTPAGWIGGGGLFFVLLAAGAAREGVFRLR
jgi:hypothetical protein